MEAKKAETTINPFTLTEDQQRYYNPQINFVGPSFANARITVYEYFAEDDINPLVRQICRTYGST